MQTLVFMSHGEDEPYTTSKIVAEQAKVQHETVVRLLSNYKTDIEEFGILRFKIGKITGRGRPETIYLLNEQQITLLITYLQNTPAVRALKKELVRQFYEMRSLIIELQSSVWKDTREWGKQIRKDETDNIKKLVDYATEHGSQNANRYYTLLSQMADKASGITKRDEASIKKLTTLWMVERVIGAKISQGIRDGLPYKTIFQNCKKRVDSFCTVAGLN